MKILYVVLFVFIFLLLPFKQNKKSLKILFLFISLFITVKSEFQTITVTGERKTYLTKLTYYYTGDSTGTGDYLPGLGKRIGELGDLAGVNENGWYFYKKDGINYLMVATATEQCLNTKEKSGACYNYKMEGRINGIKYRNYGDTFILSIDGIKYNAMVVDSCGGCMKRSNVGNEHIDILSVKTGKNPGNMKAEVIEEETNSKYNADLTTNNIIYDDISGVQYDYMPSTTYTGDIKDGYLYKKFLKENEYSNNSTSEQIEKYLNENSDYVIASIYQRVIDGLSYHGFSYNDNVDNGFIGDFIGSVGGIEAGEVSTWRQGDSKWGSIPLGKRGKTIKNIGCAATSVAIQIVRSGAELSTDFPGNLNPGSFVQFLTANKGFTDGGGIYWAKASLVAPTFKYVTNQSLNSSNAIRIIGDYVSKGYYLIVHVNGGKNRNTSNHWMAVTGVTENDILVIDPAGKGPIGYGPSLDTTYGIKYVDAIAIYKVG